MRNWILIVRMFLGLLVLGIVVGLGWLAVGYWWPMVPEMSDPFKIHVVEEAARQIALALPDPPTPGLLLFTPLAGDPQGVISQPIAREIENSGKYKCLEIARVMERYREKGGTATMGNSEALTLARDLRADLAAYGTIIRFSKTDEGSELTIRLSVLSTEKGQVLLDEQLFSGRLRRSFSMAYYRAWMASHSRAARILLWFLGSGLLPFLLWKLLQRFLAREDNLINLVLVLSLTGVSFLTALALMGFAVAGLADGLTALAAFLGGGFYYWVALTWLDEKRR